MRQYFTPAVVLCVLAAGACSRKHSSDSAAAWAAAGGTVAAPARMPAATPPSLATASVPAELPPPEKKRATLSHDRKSAAAHRVRPLEDPRRIPPGISYDAMVRRFGPPSIVVTDGPGRSSLSYVGRSSRVQVEVQDGRVLSVASSSTGR